MLLGTMGLALWSLLEVRPQCANSLAHISLSWVTPPLFGRNRYNLFGRPSRRDARQTPLATAREGELAAEALGVEEVTHGAHGEPEGSMPERELLELPMSATARVEAPRHQVRSEKPNGRNCYSSRLRVRYHDSPSPPRGIAVSFTQHRVRTSVREPVREHVQRGCMAVGVSPRSVSRAIEWPAGRLVEPREARAAEAGLGERT